MEEEKLINITSEPTALQEDVDKNLYEIRPQNSFQVMNGN